MLKVNNATYLYDTTASTRKGVEAVSFSLQQGEALAILGRSGSGKSTLLKAVAGLLDLQQGDVYLGNERIKGPAYSLIPGNKTIKYVAQDFDLKPDYTARENIKDHLDYHYTPEKKEQIINKLIKLFQLKDIENNHPRELSGGQQQRVAIAGCLAEMPKLLLLDEPFNDLDYYTKSQTIELIKNACKQFNTSLILVTHHYEECFILSDKLMVMSKGKIVQKGTVEQLFTQPKNQAIAGLMGDFSVLKQGEIINKTPLSGFLIIRPYQVSVTDTEQGIACDVVQCTYMGNYYRVLAKSQLGSELIFHAAKPHSGKIVLNVTIA
jgi:iron(III) transport system ATP-binding protein